jgi:hypothetical protein
MKNEGIFCVGFTNYLTRVYLVGGFVGGASEIATLRNPETNDEWRIIASVVGLIFLFRWMVHLRAFIRSENTSPITVKNDDEVKDLDVGIGDLELKESTSTEASGETFEESPMLNEAIPVSPSVLRQPSGTLDRQISVEHPRTPSTMMDMQPTGILHRQISVRNSPPPSPKHFYPSSPPLRQLEP